MHTNFARSVQKGITVLGLLLCFVICASAQDELYVSGKRHWLAAEYPLAYDLLLQYRTKPYGRTAEVDFMLGTSGCRIPELRERGAQILAWVFYNYPLTNRSRALIAKEAQRCRTVGAVLPALDSEAMEGMETLISAGASFRGKMFYWAEKGSPVASYPVRQVQKIEPFELQARLIPLGKASRVQEVVSRLAPGFKVFVQGPFVFATSVVAHNESTIRDFQRALEKYVDFLVAHYHVVPPDNYITIYLVERTEDLRRLGERLHGLRISPATIGYTFRDDLSAVAVIPGYYPGTLFHELWHLLVRNNFGDIPQWLDEGIAGLYEVSMICGDVVIGVPNWRGQVLQELWSIRPPIAAVIASEWFGSDKPEIGRSTDDTAPDTRRLAITMAIARYFSLYLQDKGILQTIYEKYRLRDPVTQLTGTPHAQAVRLVEETLQQSIAEINTDFIRWFRAMPNPTEGAPPASSCKSIEKYTAR